MKRAAQAGEDRLCTGRLGLLLLASGRSLREEELAVYFGGAQDRTPCCGLVAGAEVEALAAHRRRRPMRVFYQPEGCGKACLFLALRYEKAPEAKQSEQPEQYQLFDTSEYTYRVFATNMDRPLDALVWFYNQRAGAEPH